MPEPASKAPNTQSANAPGSFVDPFLSFNFRLSIPGVMEARFTQCTGLGVQIDSISYVEGGSSIEHQIPGRVHYDPVILQWGLTESTELLNWLQTSITRPVQRKNVQILVLDHDGMTEKVRWTLYNAWPSRWRSAPLISSVSSVALHTLELVYEYSKPS